MDDLMIRISHVSKEYRLGQIGGTTLREELQRKTAKLLKREDPTAKIGQKSVEHGKRFLALDDVSLDIRPGEAVGIIGRNGAGKSTLLKLLSRVTAPSSGEIGLNGRIASMLEVGTGFHPELTGRENIYMNGAILGMTKREIDSKLEEIIDFSEVRPFIDTPVKRYSSGMYVKLAFSVAAHLDSEIMIMDEVLAVGDMAFQQKCIDKMSNACKQDGRTILYVSHNMNTIRQLCDRCIVLDHGHLIFDGDVDKAISLYLNHSLGSEVPRMDFTEYQRQKYLQRTDIRIDTIELIGKEDIHYFRDEKVKIRYHWHVNADVKNVGIRFEIRNENDVPTATSVGYNLYTGKAGDRAELNCLYDLSILAPGRYKTVFTVFEKSSYGLGADLDCVFAMDLIVEEPTLSNLAWDAKHWGNIILPDPVLVGGD